MVLSLFQAVLPLFFSAPYNNNTLFFFNSQAGGSGGGRVNFQVKENLILDGTVDVSGAKGINPGSSGGSGGSILLSSKSFKGKGSLIADGGDSGNSGNPGSGSGGRIASYSLGFEFTGKKQWSNRL